MFPDLYVMRWLSCFLKHVFPRSRSNARAYSRILSPSTSGSGLPYPMPPCTSQYPVPAWHTWPFQSPHGIKNPDAGILAVTARSWSKNRSLTWSLRPLCGAYTDRNSASASPIWRGGLPLLPSPAAPLPFLSCPLSYFNSRLKTLHFGENFMKIGPKLKKVINV